MRIILWSLLCADILFPSIVAVNGNFIADNPLSENASEWKSPGFVQVVGAGVNATAPLTTWRTPPAWLPSSTVEQAYLYVALIYDGAIDDPVASVTVTLNAMSQGTMGPSASDFVNAAYGEFWNIYRFDVTSFVASTGDVIYAVDVSADVSNAHVSNVVLVVVYSDPAASYKHIILNDGMEALMDPVDPNGVNQTTVFHAVGPSFATFDVIVAVAEGTPQDDVQGLEEVWIEWLNHGSSHKNHLWNSTEGPDLDIEEDAIGFAPPQNFCDVNATVVTGVDAIG